MSISRTHVYLKRKFRLQHRGHVQQAKSFNAHSINYKLINQLNNLINEEKYRSVLAVERNKCISYFYF